MSECSLILSSLKREHSLKTQTHNFLLKSPTLVKAFRGVGGILLISNSITAPRLFAVLVTFSVIAFHSSGGLLKRFNENDLVNNHLAIRITRLLRKSPCKANPSVAIVVMLTTMALILNILLLLMMMMMMMSWLSAIRAGRTIVGKQISW